MAFRALLAQARGTVFVQNALQSCRPNPILVMKKLATSTKQGWRGDCAQLACIHLLLIVLSLVSYRPTLAVQCWTPGDEANRPYCKEFCCSNVCLNATDFYACKAVNLTSLTISSLPVKWGCESIVRNWCICYFEEGVCNGTTVDNIVNDTDVTSFPQQSQYINRTTLLLICLPLVFAIMIFACGLVCSTGRCRQCMGDLIWKIKPLQPKTEEEEEEDDDDDDGEDGDGDGEGNEMERARAKAKTLGEWTLDVIVLQARNLPRSDIPIVDKFLVGLADPYALIGMRNKRRERKTPYEPEHRTETKKSTLNPTWNETFRLQFSGTKDDVSVQVWDWDKWKYDDYIGEALIPTGPMVQAFKPGNTAFGDAQWFELYDKQGEGREERGGGGGGGGGGGKEGCGVCEECQDGRISTTFLMRSSRKCCYSWEERKGGKSILSSSSSPL
eukprot:766909-Hanusia_phi.AAC.1